MVNDDNGEVEVKLRLTYEYTWYEWQIWPLPLRLFATKRHLYSSAMHVSPSWAQGHILESITQKQWFGNPPSYHACAASFFPPFVPARTFTQPSFGPWFSDSSPFSRSFSARVMSLTLHFLSNSHSRHTGLFHSKLYFCPYGLCRHSENVWKYVLSLPRSEEPESLSESHFDI